MIQFKNVSKSFGKIHALKNITLDFPEGKIIGLFGPNGAGKSTMLKLIAGLSSPSQGEVLVAGQKPNRCKEKIAFLPEINHLYSWWTLKQAVEFMQAFYLDWDEKCYQDQLQFLNLDENMKLSKISKGQLAKCKLLLTLSRKADYLLMDEPFSGIDLMTREDIINALIRDYQQGEHTIIISTHEIDEIENLVDNVLFIEGGEIKLWGEAEELRQSKQMSLVEIMKEAFKHAEQ
ncbi:ABC transporter ATP-binding protein [Bacillota bacterium LX-D]|nr:ABC transporter ATP-binding protein [Bacillota bacterium LX-D]